MKKILMLLSIINLVSFSKVIQGNFKYNINQTKNYDYEVKANFKDDKWIYDPKFKYNRYNSTHQVANINGDFKLNNGIFLKYNLQTPIKIDFFDDENKGRGKNNNKSLESKKRSALNPNHSSKVHFDFDLGYNKTFFLNKDITLNNLTELKYIASTFYGLENLDEKKLDISESLTLFNKYANFNINGKYQSISLTRPLEYNLGFAIDKNIFDSNFKFKFNVNHKLDELMAKNKITDMTTYLDTTPHEHSGEKTPFFVQEQLEGHERRANESKDFTDKFKSFYLIPEISIEYSKKLNKNIFLNASNTTKYQILKYSGEFKINNEDEDDEEENQEKFKTYLAKFDLIENQTNLNLRYSTNKLNNISNIKFGYKRSIHDNNYENKNEFTHSSINFINILNEKKRNFQEINFGSQNKLLYDIKINDKLSITPRLFLEYEVNGKSFIFTDIDKKTIIESIQKLDKEKKELEIETKKLEKKVIEIETTKKDDIKKELEKALNDKKEEKKKKEEEKVNLEKENKKKENKKKITKLKKDIKKIEKTIEFIDNELNNKVDNEINFGISLEEAKKLKLENKMELEKNKAELIMKKQSLNVTKNQVEPYKQDLKREKFKFNHKLIIEPGIFVNYKFENGINLYTSLDIPFIFKTREAKNLGIKKQTFEKVAFQKIKQENPFLPNNYNIKINAGIKFKF